ncbi:MAG: hypothetical protein HDS25_00930 [Bacteroides sp.]|nr:hypothetical protein [Bacteroides sp.]
MDISQINDVWLLLLGVFMGAFTSIVMTGMQNPHKSRRDTYQAESHGHQPELKYASQNASDSQKAAEGRTKYDRVDVQIRLTIPIQTIEDNSQSLTADKKPDSDSGS